MHETQPNFEVFLANSSLEIDFKYNLTTDPILVEDVGTGKVWFEGLNISILANPLVK